MKRLIFLVLLLFCSIMTAAVKFDGDYDFFVSGKPVVILRIEGAFVYIIEKDCNFHDFGKCDTDGAAIRIYNEKDEIILEGFIDDCNTITGSTQKLPFTAARRKQ